MNVSPYASENSPERPISELCVNLESQFVDLQELSKAEAMRVYSRVRPMLDSEIETGYKECIGTIDDQTVRAIVPATSAKYKSSSHLSHDIIEDFTFTAAYGPGTGQFVFFEECMMSTMQNFIEGQNSLLFSYGTTGSGKTFTLQGDADNPGIIPLSLHLFFASIEGQLLDKIVVKPDKFADVIALNDDEIKRELEIKEQILSNSEQEEWNYRSSSSKSFAMMLCDTFSENFQAEGRETTLCPEEMAQAQAAAMMKELSKKSADRQTGYCNIWISFVEIYNESIYDLLQPNVNQRPKLTLGEDKNGDVYVKGLREICVSNSYEALKLLTFGQRNLNIASTKLNYKSSRSHCIFTIKVVRLPDPENMSLAKVNRLSFCDLAGSERAAKSQTTGLRLKEAGCINTSLLVLGRCLEQLRLKPSLRDKKLIPFRESKLTRLFSGFFTGRGKAVMIINASPCELTFDETLHVLRFSALAKELIINDSYIATASSTLQSITNMWAIQRANTSDSSDRSICFEDPVDEVILEKDQLIEKLLDLAESLRNNLEKEKREKAELEIKIRQDVCEEYSEISDELLDNQREIFEKERESLREIYEKRISRMEEMYENIIKDYKLQFEESESSEDESFEIVESKKENETAKASESPITDGFMKNTDIASEFTAVITEDSKTKEELHKTVDYSLSLEIELETLRREVDDIKLQLETTMKDNEEMKKELDSCKIDCYAYKTDNDGLLIEKSALEQDIVSLSKDLAFVTHEKEALEENMKELEDKVAKMSNEIQNLLCRNTELVEVQEESSMNYEKFLEEANMKNDEMNKKLLSISHELEEERGKNTDLEFLVATLEAKISELQVKEIQKDNAENISNELSDIKVKYIKLQKELENSEKSEFQLNEIICKLNTEIEQLRNVRLEDEKKLIDVVKQHETELEKLLVYKCELDVVKKELDEAQLTINKQKLEINQLLAENNSNNNELQKLKKLNNELEEKIYSKTEAENLLYKQELDITSKKLEEAQLTIIKQKEDLDNLAINISCKTTEIEKLTELNNMLEEKITHAESEKLPYKQELDVVRKELDEAQLTIGKHMIEINELLAESTANKEELEKQEKLNNELEEKMNSKTKAENLLHKQELDITSKKLEECQLTIIKQKEDLDNLAINISCKNTEIEKLNVLNNVLEEKITHAESEKLAHKQELDVIRKELDEAVLTIGKQKREIDELLAESNSNKDVLDKLQKLNDELEEKVNSKTESENFAHKQELDFLKKELEEAQLTINEQKMEINKLLAENTDNKAELQELKKLTSELEEERNSRIGGILDLVDILENCEFHASNKIKKMNSDSAEFKTKIENLENKIKKGSEDKKKESDSLCKLIEILETCEMVASIKAKQLHTSSIKHVEQIMDLEKSVKSKERIIENLKKDFVLLQKKLKESELTLKKQLQNEKHKYEVEINSIRDKQITVEKENASVKKKLNELEAIKEKLLSETENLKIQIQKVAKENTHEEKEKTQEKPTKQAKKQRRRPLTEKPVENQPNTEVHEEAEENGKREIKQETKRVRRKELRSVENIEDAQNKDFRSSKTKTSKRKGHEETNQKSSEQALLKKIKMYDGDENVSKPQNLTIKALKANFAVNNISVPSPRMTRGRKRLVNLQSKNIAESKASPRTMRS